MNPVSKNTGTFKSYDGTKIYYEVRGTGRPVVFAYGIACLSNHWRHQIKHFSQHFQTITFDYRAHHKSEIPQDHSQISVDALARDIHSLMDHLGLKSAGFVGHSFATQVLLRSYDIAPEYFNNMTFINGFASDPIRGMFGNEAASKAFELLKSGFDLAPETISYIWRVLLNNPIAAHGMALAGGFNLSLTAIKDVEIYVRGVGAMDLKAFLTLFESMMNYDGRPVFDRIEVPTLIIAGKKDNVTPLKYQEEMHLKIKNSQFMMVPYGSHCTQLDMPDYVNLRIEKFFGSIGYGSGLPTAE
jgi:pimeloyl-ACP methyl ester carboxylesterase